MTYRTRAFIYLLGLFMVAFGAIAAVQRSTADDHSGVAVFLFSAISGIGAMLIHLGFILDRKS